MVGRETSIQASDFENYNVIELLIMTYNGSASRCFNHHLNTGRNWTRAHAVISLLPQPLDQSFVFLSAVFGHITQISLLKVTKNFFVKNANTKNSESAKKIASVTGVNIIKIRKTAILSYSSIFQRFKTHYTHFKLPRYTFEEYIVSI